MPRKLTNNAGLPSPIYYAIKNDTYEARGDISVTGLIDAEYQRVLKKYNEYEEDASESVWALQGSAIHAMIERVGRGHNQEEFIPEKQLMIKVLGRDLSGTPDLIERQRSADNKNILHDFKNIFVWAAKLGITAPSYKKWEKQTNIYVQMIKEKLGFDIHEIQVHAFIRDWSRNRSEYESNYPQLPVVTYNVPIYSSESVWKYMEGRMKAHVEADDLYKRGFDKDVPVCSEEDRWAKDEIWRMMKNPESKRSSKNFVIKSKEDEKPAMIYYATNLATNPKLWINKSPGEDTRCVNYCPVSQFCRYYKSNYDNYGKKLKDPTTESTTLFESPNVSPKSKVADFDF